VQSIWIETSGTSNIARGIMYHVLLDFDANKSIVKLGNGGYKLKPVIRTVESAISGAIKVLLRLLEH
jgi:hypothetical protein